MKIERSFNTLVIQYQWWLMVHLPLHLISFTSPYIIYIHFFNHRLDSAHLAQKLAFFPLIINKRKANQTDINLLIFFLCKFTYVTF